MSLELNVAQAWALILGFITPLIVAFVRKPGTSRRTAQIVSLATALVVGIVNLAIQGFFNNMEFTPGGIMVALAAVLGASQAAYVLLWKPTGVEPALDEWTNEHVYAGKHAA